MMRKLIRALPYILTLVAWTLILWGVGAIEQIHSSDIAVLWPYIVCTFAGLGMFGVAAVLFNLEEARE